MAITVNTNIASLTAQRNLSGSQNILNKSLTRLSSGLRINSARDDAAGLAISDRMTSQIRGLNQAVRNANDGISLAQTAEGALQESTNILQRIRELAIQSANATNSATDRNSLQAEVNQLQLELNRIATSTTFNGVKVLDGSFTTQTFQVGALANETISVSISGAGTTDLGRFSISGSNTEDNQGTGSVTAAAAALPANNVIADQTLTITGSNGSATVALGGAGKTAEQIADLVNDNSASTGVSASASTTAYLDNLQDANGTSLSLEIGSGSTLTTVTTTTLTLEGLAYAINEESGKTGITATYDASNSRVVLTQAEGKDIKVQNFLESAGTPNATIDLGGVNDSSASTLTGSGSDDDSAIVAGTVEFYSTDDFSVSSSVANSDGSVVDAAADTSPSSTKSTVSQVDVSTITSANTAISIIDGAVSKLDQIRGDLGAVQNRFDHTIANLQSVAENVSAARSRIVDADFAAETANMTKAQILQQAGLAMLAQANTLPQAALTLLQG